MFVVINDKNDKCHSIFKFLRTNAPDANINTLRQISIYIANSNKEDFVDNNFGKLSYDKENNYFTYKVNNDKKVVFSNNPDDFGFLVLSFNLEKKLIMLTDVSLRVFGDLTTLNVYSEIITDSFGRYVVTFRPNDMSDESVKFGTINYYTNDEVDWIHEIVGKENIDRNFDVVAKENGIYPFAEKLFFDIPLEDTNTYFDCYDGGLRNYLERVDLLFNNLSVCMNNKIKKRQMK